MPDDDDSPKRARTDVALGQHRVAAKSSSPNGSGSAGSTAASRRLMSTSRSPGTPIASGSRRAVGVAEHHDDVLQRVGGGPRPTVVPGELGTAVEMVDKRGDRRRVRRVVDDRRRQAVDRPVRCRSDAHGLDVGGVAAVRAAHERVLAARDRGQELLAGRPTHRPGHRRDDDEGHTEALERLDVGVAVALVGHGEPVVVEIEAVGVLHHELATAQQPGSWSCLVAVLRLDLVDDEGQVLVRRVQVLDEEREHLLVGRGEQEVVAAAVLEPEHPVAVLDPPVRRLVRRPRAAAPGSGPPGIRPRSSRRGRCARRGGTRSIRAAAT